MVHRAIASAEPSIDDVVGNRGPDPTAGEPELAEIAISLEHEGPDRTPCGRAIEGAAHVVLMHLLTGVPSDRLMDRRSHRNSRALRKAPGTRKTPAGRRNKFPEDSYLKRLAGPVVK